MVFAAININAEIAREIIAPNTPLLFDMLEIRFIMLEMIPMIANIHAGMIFELSLDAFKEQIPCARVISQ